MIFFKTLPITQNKQLVWGFFIHNVITHSRELFQTELTKTFSQHKLHFAYTRQVHGNTIEYIEKAGTYKDIDGYTTHKPNLVLSIYTADCMPVIMFNQENHSLGIAHAGWKGTRDNIILKLVEKLTPKVKSKVNNIKLLIDFLPHISQDYYEVGREFTNYFYQESLKQKGNAYYLSLNKTNIKALKDNKIEYEFLPHSFYKNMKRDEFCTFTNPNLPSFRQKSEGRIFSFCFLLSPEP